MAEIRINATGGVKLYDADDSHYAQILAGTITSNVNAITLGHNIATFNAAITAGGIIKTDDTTAATSTTDGSLQTDGGLSVALDGVIGDDLLMLSDASVIHFGADSEVTLTHSADVGLNLKHTATADDKPIVLTLQTGETDMAAGDVIGKIAFQAPDEGTGTDAILVSAAIQAVAEGDHSSSSNATRLEFMTGASEAAAEKMRITSGGDVGIGTTSIGARFVVADDIADFVARFTNDGNDENRDGIYIQGGADDGAGTTTYLMVADGDGNATGELQTSSGTFQLTDTSDSRLKQDIVDTSIKGIDSIKSLKVRDFAYKKNPTETIVGGFIAQELKEVYPQAVSEGKTEEKILSASRERLVPLLTKALQEAITKIETLEAKVAVLEG